jgi:cell division protein FtsQ
VTTVVRLLPRAVALLPRLAAPLGPHWRRRLAIAGLLLAALGAAYMLWFRDSSFVRVEQVEVTGLATAPGASTLEAQLTEAAKGMTTLHADEDALRGVVADDPVVLDLRLVPDFPNRLTIEVVERQPVAIVSGSAGEVPVAADGTVLKGVEFDGNLPEISTTTVIPSSGRLGSGPALDRVEVAAAAPAPLRGKIGSITIQPEKGLVAQIADGPAVWLGDGERLEAKWNAAAAVLAERSSAGASYVDVRVPERSVAGGLVVATEPQESPADAAPDVAPVEPAEPVPAPVEPAVPAAPVDPAAPPADPQPSLEP